MSEQVGKLREQMVSAIMLPVPDMPEDQQVMFPMFGPMMGGGMWQQRRMK